MYILLDFTIIPELLQRFHPYYWFEGTPEADNYSIYDNVLAKTLVDYANTHGLHKILNGGVKFKESNFKNYEIYSQVIDVLRTKYGENISRNGFDHLLWYAYKGQ